jgi:hypothetical protein
MDPRLRALIISAPSDLQTYLAMAVTELNYQYKINPDETIARYGHNRIAETHKLLSYNGD